MIHQYVDTQQSKHSKRLKRTEETVQGYDGEASLKAGINRRIYFNSEYNLQETAIQRQASELIRRKKTQTHVSLSSFLCFLWVFCVLSRQLQTSYRNIRNSMLYRSVFKSQTRYCLVD